MPYLLLIREPRGQRLTRNAQQGDAAYQSMLRFGAELREAGQLLASESLVADDEAVRVQRRDGRQTLTDGPFAEAKEMIGGFFLLNCTSRDEAVAIAGRCPAAEWATVEVRETGPCNG